MGLDVSRALPHPGARPFLAWDSKTTQAFATFVRSCTGTTLRLSKWHMLEFVGTERLEEVTALFALFDEESDSSVNGAQLAAALVLCNRETELQERLQRCLELFDWTGQGAASVGELALLLKVCSTGLRRCLQGVVDAAGPVSIRDLCSRAIPEGGLATHEDLVEWACSDDAVRVPLELLVEEDAGEAGVPLDPDSTSLVVDADVSIMPAPDEAECSEEVAADVVAEMADQEATAQASGPEPREESGSGAGEARLPSPPRSSGATTPVRPQTSQSGDQGSRHEEEFATVHGEGELGQEGRSAAVAEEEEGELGLEGRSAIEIVEQFVAGTTESLTLRASAVEGLMQEPHAGASMLARWLASADLLEQRWQWAEGFLLPLAHGGAASAIADGAANTNRRRKPPSNTLFAAIRDRIWLRQSCFVEESRFEIAQVAHLLDAQPPPSLVRQAQHHAAEQLSALLSPGGPEPRLRPMLEQLVCVAEERHVLAMQELEDLAASYERPGHQLRREVLRLQGAAAFLAKAGADVTGEPLERLRDEAEALCREHGTALTALEAQRPQFEASLLDFLTSRELGIAVQAALAAPQGSTRAALRRARAALLPSSVHADAGARTDACATAAQLEIQERRWRHCEGATAAERALARGSSIRLEVWLFQARQFRSLARRSTLCSALNSVNRGLAKTTTSEAQKTTLSPSRKRLHVLVAVHKALTSLQTSTGSSDEVPVPSLEQVLPEVLRTVRAAVPASAAEQNVSVEQEAVEKSADHLETSKAGGEVSGNGAGAGNEYFRQLRFEQRAHQAALMMAAALERAPGVTISSPKAPARDELTRRLRDDLEQSSEVLASVEHSPAFQQRSAAKWSRTIDSVASELSSTCVTLDQGLAYVRQQLAAVGAKLLSSHAAVAGASANVKPARPLAPVEPQMLASFLPSTGATTGSWGGTAEPYGGVAVARHEQLAAACGVLWALELAREGAGRMDVRAGDFALMKRCVQLRVEARLLEAIAEQRMGDAELAVASRAKIATPGAEMEFVEEALQNILVSFEGLVKTCYALDFVHLLGKWQEDPNLQPKGDIMTQLAQGVRGPAEVESLEGGGSSSDPHASPAPPIPAAGSWLRGEDGHPQIPFDNPPCPQCLAVARLLLNVESDDARGFAVALRVWLLARAQRSAASMLLPSASPEAPEVSTAIHSRRTLRRFLEILWRKGLQARHMAEHVQSRSVALRRAVAFIEPLTAGDADILEAEDLALHVDEVRRSLDRALAPSSDGPSLQGLSFTGLGDDAEGRAREGMQAAIATFSLADEDKAAKPPGLAAAAAALTAKPAARDLAGISIDMLGSSSGAAATVAGVSASPPGADDTELKHYMAQLCGTLCGLDLLEAACRSARAGGR